MAPGSKHSLPVYIIYIHTYVATFTEKFQNASKIIHTCSLSHCITKSTCVYTLRSNAVIKSTCVYVLYTFSYA